MGGVVNNVCTLPKASETSGVMLFVDDAKNVADQLKDLLNGHTSMLIKCFKIGAYWKHGDRVRETMMGEGQAVCPLSLLYKDHKGWSASMGSPPPTRPVA